MSLETLLAQWGLPAIFAGSAVEGDGTAFLAGVMAHRHLFPFEVAALTVAAGAFLGDEALYFIGRHSARFPFARRWLEKGPVARVQGLMQRYPAGLILGFRFLYGMRTVGAVTMGASGIRPGLFVPLNLLAVLVWAHVFVGLGFGLSITLHRLVGHMPLLGHLLIGMAVAAATGLVAFWLHRGHRGRRARRRGNGSG